MSVTRTGQRRRSRTRALTLALVLAAGLLLAAGCTSSDNGGATSTTTAKLDKLTLVAAPGPMAIPMAYLVANDRLADVAQETELLVWENADQLKAMVAGGQGDFVTVPSNTAAIFHNKGLQLQLLDISVWNITYLVTSDADAASFSDIKGQSLVVSLQGSPPDVMFQYLATKQGLDPQKDFDLRYVTDPTQAAQLLVAGEVQNAVLSEPLATAALLQTKAAEQPLRRALAFDAAWAYAAAKAAQPASEEAGATGGVLESRAVPSALTRTPIAGVVATARVMDKPEVIAAFEREYALAVEWMVANPEAAGRLVETELPQLGLKAAVMTASLQNITWDHTPAAEARADLEAFFTALSEISPAFVGGKLPADAFYYAP
jgi:NitT/TauT family transport system substrate-binding protein